MCFSDKGSFKTYLTAYSEQGWGRDLYGEEPWGESYDPTVSLTAPSALTSSVGSLNAFNEEGWGRTQYGNAGWGVTYSVELGGLSLTASVGQAEIQTLQILTGIGLTSSLGTPITEIGVPITAPSGLTSSVGALTEVSTNAGWGRDTWGQEPWGDSDEPVVTLTGLGLTASLGEVSAYNEQGWGRDPWGYENWGESAMTVVVDVESSGVATTNVGAITPTEMSIGLSGQSATASVGTPGLAFGVSTEPISTAGVVTTSVGSVNLEIGVPLTGIGSTASVGSPTIADMAIGLSGLGATISVGEAEATEAQIVDVTGIGLTTSVGIIDPTPMAVGLTGVSATGSVGSLAPTEMTIGLIGIEGTASIGEVSPLYTRKLSYNTSASYTTKTYDTSASYTKKNHAG